MPLKKELEKIFKKAPREIGRIVMQTGNFLSDATDSNRLERWGKKVAKEGERIIDRENDKLHPTHSHVPTTTMVDFNILGSNTSTLDIAASDLVPSTSASNAPNITTPNITTSDPLDSDTTFSDIPTSDDVEFLELDETIKDKFVHELNRNDDIESLSSYVSNSSILIQKNLDLTKRVSELETQLRLIRQQFLRDENGASSSAPSASSVPPVLTLRLTPNP